MVPYIIDKVKVLILTGPTADKIEAAVKKDSRYMGYNPNIMRADNLEQAVELAHKNAVAGDVVTLSPACASFDVYPNFAVRGDKFKELVNAL
jgi:UDP-N-acetylmuramoylalanine--D-glutamate ligase